MQMADMSTASFRPRLARRGGTEHLDSGRGVREAVNLHSISTRSPSIQHKTDVISLTESISVLGRVMTWVRLIGAGVISVRACSSGGPWVSARAEAPTTSMEVGTTPCRPGMTSQEIPGSSIGDGAIYAPGYSTPDFQRRDGAQPRRQADTTGPAARTSACTTEQISRARGTGGGAISVRACSTPGTQLPGSARKAADTTTRTAKITE
jgi:hypothetical protein